MTGTDAWVVTVGGPQAASGGDGRACVRELEGEVDGFGFADEDDAQIAARADQADLIAHGAGDQRRLRIIQDDRRLAVEPAWRDVDAGADQVPAEWANLIEQGRAGPIDHLAAPGEPAGEPQNWPFDLGPLHRHNRNALGVAIWNVAHRAIAKQIVQLRL